MSEGTPTPDPAYGHYDVSKPPWYATLVSKTVDWVFGHGIGVFLLLFFVGVLIWQGKSEDKQRIKILEAEMIDCKADRKLLREMVNELIQENRLVPRP